MKSPLLGLGSAALLLFLAGCKGSSLLEIKGTVARTSGQVVFNSTNGTQTVLDSRKIGTRVTASFYDFEGDARLSLRFSDQVDPLILSFGQKTTDMAPSVQARNAHAVATNHPVTVDLTRGETIPVHEEWDGSGSCVYWQGYVQVCDGDPRDPKNCHDELRTIYGTAEFHYVRSGSIDHTNLQLTQTSGSALLDLVEDNTNTTSQQISQCISSERPPPYRP